MDASRGLSCPRRPSGVHDSRPSRVHSLILKILEIFGNFSKFFPSTNGKFGSVDGIFGRVSRIFGPNRIFRPSTEKNFEKFPKIFKIFKIKLWTLDGRESWTLLSKASIGSPRLASIESPQLNFKNFGNFWKFFKIFSVDGRKIRFGEPKIRFSERNFRSHSTEFSVHRTENFFMWQVLRKIGISADTIFMTENSFITLTNSLCTIFVTENSHTFHRYDSPTPI